jgi:hypothetical protein
VGGSPPVASTCGTPGARTGNLHGMRRADTPTCKVPSVAVVAGCPWLGFEPSQAIHVAPVRHHAAQRGLELRAGKPVSILSIHAPAARHRTLQSCEPAHIERVR